MTLSSLPSSPVNRQSLLTYLDDLGIDHTTVDHAPVFTVAEADVIKAKMPGGHTKNLFLKDKKGALILISALQSTQIDLKQLHKKLACGRLSFGKAELLETKLGVQPGSVTAFALINDPDQHVRFILDANLMAHDIINFHPMRNDATTAIRSDDLLVFIQALDRNVEILNLEN